MKGPGIEARERLETLSALACVALILGFVTGSQAGPWTALGLLLFALFLPVPSAWFVRGWKTVTHGIAKVVTALLLVVVHLLVVTPTGLLRRIGRKPPAVGSAFVPADEPESGPAPASWDRPG